MSSVTIISSNNMLSIFIPFVANKLLLDETKKLFLVTNFESNSVTLMKLQQLDIVFLYCHYYCMYW